MRRNLIKIFICFFAFLTISFLGQGRIVFASESDYEGKTPVETIDVSMNSDSEVYAKLYTNEEDSTKYDLVITGSGEWVSTLEYFDYNESVVKVIIGDGVTNIPDNAFYHYDSYGSIVFGYLRKVDISDTVTSIGERAFANTTSLSSIDIPNSVTSIGNYSFYFSHIRYISIPDTVTSIGDYAFCLTFLKNVHIPSSVTSIGNYVFTATDLTSIHIPSSVTSIGEQAFGECDYLTSVTGMKGVTSIGAGSFWETSLSSIDIPSSVTSIGDKAFYNCYKLTKVTGMEGVTSIGDSAFEWTSLTSIDIPSSVTSIGNSVFEDCEELTEVTGMEGLTSIGNYAFEYTSLTSIDIPSSVTSIGDHVFAWSDLTSIDIPSSVTSIGKYAFYNCYKLTKVTGMEGVTSIGKYAFRGTALTSIHIPNSVTSIGEYVFKDCEYLTEVTGMEGVTSIGDSAFYGTAIAIIHIPNSVTSIGDGAFWHCKELTEVTGMEGVTSIGDHAFYGTAIAIIHIPSSVTSIGDSAFSRTSLTSIDIPSSVTSIADNAFSNTEIKRISIYNNELSVSSWIPSSVTTIRAHPNSLAHQYAKDNNIDYECIFEVRYNSDNSEASVIDTETGINLMTIRSPQNLVYDANPKNILIEYMDYSNVVDLKVSYTGENNGDTYNSNIAPINAGNYSAHINLKGQELTFNFTIDKAQREILVEPTLASSDLKYTGIEQTIITAGQTNDGDILYSLDRIYWSIQLPKALDAGRYTVYYKLEGDSNHYGSEEESIEVTIDKAVLKVIANDVKIWKYGKLPTLTYYLDGLLGDDALEYEFSAVSRVDARVYVEQEDFSRSGKYEIFVTGENDLSDYNANYDIVYVNGTLTVRALSIEMIVLAVIAFMAIVSTTIFVIVRKRKKVNNL